MTTMRFMTNHDPGDEQPTRPSYYPHDDICQGKGTARGKEWPECCGSKTQIEEFYDDIFDDFYPDDWNDAEAEEDY